MVRLLAVVIVEKCTEAIELKVDSHASIGTLKGIVLDRIPEALKLSFSSKGGATRWFLTVNEGRAKDITRDSDTRSLQDYGLTRHGNILYLLSLPAGTDPLQRIQSIETCLTSSEPLQKAAELNDVAAIKILLTTKRAQVDSADEYGSTALHLAGCSGSAAAIEALIEYGANPNVRDFDRIAPIHQASYGHVAAVEALIANGADPNAGDNDASTALHIAAFQGHTAVISALLALGANPNATNDDGRTPLHNATSFGLSSTMELLIAAGTRIDAGDRNGQTALHITTNLADPEPMRLLIASGANISRGDNFSSPLHAAAHMAQALAIEKLLDNGADAEAKQKDGKTPLATLRGTNSESAKCRGLLESATVQCL